MSLGILHIGSATQAARLHLLVQMVSTALRDPADNAVVALLVLGVAALLLLLVLAIVFLVVTIVDEWRRPAPVVPARARAERVSAEGLTPARAIAWGVVLMVVLVAVTIAYGYATSDATCARCHTMSHAFASRKTDTHAAVACSRCHVAPGLGGAFFAAASGASNLRIQLVSNPADKASAQAQVPNSACLSCHKDVTTGVDLSGGIRMRHSDVLAVGYACTDCHSTVGHGPDAVTPARRPTMGQCVQCHDGTKAAGACVTCHSRDVGATSAQQATAADIPKATIVTDGCRGCHQMKTCIACHGIELPHSQQFIQGYHARKALLEPQVCVKCHDVQTFCDGCHQFNVRNGLPVNPHGTLNDFINMHKGAGPATGGGDSASCSCHTKGGPRQALCDDCHAAQPSR